MQPLFRHLVIGLAPQPRTVPVTPFDREELQRAFFDVNRVRPYSQFTFLPGDSGAQFINGPQDRIVITPSLIQMFGVIDSTAERARQVAVDSLEAVAERLKLERYHQTGIEVEAHVPAPGERPDAAAFVREHLLRGSTHAEELGADFIAGGVKYRRMSAARDENLLIEPLVADNNFIFVDYHIQIIESITGLDAVAEWVNDAFSFVSGPTMSILEA
jgi:hypothetical protein